MKSFSLKFHATRSEICQIVEEWAWEHDFAVMGEFFSPEYRAEEISRAALRGGLDPDIRRVSLHLGGITVDPSGVRNALEANPDAMSILIGKSDKGSLAESLMGGRSANESALKIWRGLQRSFKRSMKSGAWIVNSWTGERERLETHRYTADAKKLQDEGVVMVGQTEVITYILD